MSKKTSAEVCFALKDQVCIVILNWNKSYLTISCVEHLRSIDSTRDISIILVDNGSRAEELAILARMNLHNVLIINNKINLGYAGGMNTGIKAAIRLGYKYVWLVNNDAFPNHDCLDELVARLLSDNKIGVVYPSLRFPDNSIQMIGSVIDFETAEHNVCYVSDFKNYDENKVYFTGAIPLIRTEMLLKIGFFDSRYFAYWEDYDLCARIRADAKWRMEVVPSAECMHIQNASTRVDDQPSPIAALLMTRNYYLFIKKQFKYYDYFRLLLRYSALEIHQVLRFNKQGRADLASAKLAEKVCEVVRHYFGDYVQLFIDV